MNDELEARISAAELAVLALAAEADIELGDSAGHDFHGNQWTSGGTGAGRSAVMAGREDREKNRDPNAYKGRKPEPKPAPPEKPKALKPLTEKQIDRGVEKARKDLEVAIKDTLRDNPDMSADEIARDLAEAVTIDVHPDVKREFYRGEGFDFRPGERRGSSFSTEELGDSPGHEFHGNQWTAAGGSDRYAMTVGPHPWQEGKMHVSLDDIKTGEKNVDSRTVDPGKEKEGMTSLLRGYSTEAVAEREKEQAAGRERNTTRTPEEIDREIGGIEDQLREQGDGYTLNSLPREQYTRALEESKTDVWAKGTLSPPSGSEIGVTNSTLRELVKRYR